MAGLPFSGCESGRLRKAPKRFPVGLRARGRPSDGKRIFGFVTRPAESGASVGASPPVEPGLRPVDPSGRTGLRPGGCETGGPRISVYGRQAEPRLRPRILPDAVPRLRLSGPQGREAGRKFQICRAANRQGFGPVGEPAGKPEGVSASDGPRRKRRFEPPVRSAANSKPPSAGRLASQARFQQRDRDR
jgi:hypothetical protein